MNDEFCSRMLFILKCYQMLIARHLKKKQKKHTNNDILFSVAAFMSEIQGFKIRNVNNEFDFHACNSVWMCGFAKGI